MFSRCRPALAVSVHRSRLLAAAVTTVLALGQAPAHAQAPSGEAMILQEIVVTARKREESLQTTPIAVTAFTGDGLSERGIETTKDLGTFTPNLVTTNGSGVSGNNSAGAFFIRGIGQIDFTLNTDPGVGLYVDDVYVARAIGSVMELLDLESVEVLRGPQGTLFGRNTIGGAISLHSRAPAAEYGATGELQIGSDNLRRVRTSADLPINDTLMTRVSASYTKQDGFVKRVLTGEELGDVDSAAARLAVRWQPNGALTADLAIDGSRSREESPPTVATALDGASPFGSFHNAVIARNPGCLPPPGSFTSPLCFNRQFLMGADAYATNGTYDSRSELDAWGASLTVAVDPEGTLNFKSITAYRDTQAVGFRDGDHSPHLIQHTTDFYDHQQFSQEFQLSGSVREATINWIVGLYYFEEQGNNINLVDFAPISVRSGGSVDNDSAALFGQVTWRLDSLSITPGLRFTEETKRFDPAQFVLADRSPDPTMRLPPGFPLVPDIEVENSESELTPHLNVAYQWTDDLMTYVTYSEGFKSGGFTQRVFPPLPATPSFRPEFVKAYEVGAKITGFDRRLRLNAAAFFTDYTDLQVLVQVGVAPTTQNAAQAEIRGFELELSALPVGELTIDLSVGYTDAEYTSIDAAAVGITTDSQFAQIPDWTGSASVSYPFHFNGGSTLTPRVDWSYHSDVFMDATNTPAIHQDAYDLVGASVTWLSGDEHWQLRLAGTNLTDERYFTAGFADLPVAGIAEVVLARPRQWSAQVRYRY